MDIERLEEAAHLIRAAMSSSDMENRATTSVKLQIEFSDLGAMHHAHMGLLKSMSKQNMGDPRATKKDDHMITFELMGLTIAFVCRVKKASRDGLIHGYNNMKFISRDQKKT